MPESLAILGGKPIRSKPFPQWPIFDEREERALIETLRSGVWGKVDGTQCKKFERDFAAYQQAKHGVAVCNGTITMQVALTAAGIEAGDEVIIPPYTFEATATAVVSVNATPIFVDIERETFNIDPARIKEAITPRTRAIICVHLGGIPCDMDAIMAIARKHNLIVLEDAAHAHGSEYKGRRVGPIGHLGSFSFQSSKNLNSGEGGIILTNDDDLAANCVSIHNCGRAPDGPWYEHHVINGNYRLGEFAGAILNAQFTRFDEQTNRRDENARYLDEKLAKIPGISPQKRTADCTRAAYHLYVFRFDREVFGISRERFLDALNAEGISAGPGYIIPLHRQPMFLNKKFGPFTGYKNARPDLDYAKVHLPVCEQISKSEGAWMTQNMLLGPRTDMDDIANAFAKIYESRKQLAQ
jgi:dTDP-4-amino-4,6-dideoxygalactose transaminase